MHSNGYDYLDGTEMIGRCDSINIYIHKSNTEHDVIRKIFRDLANLGCIENLYIHISDTEFVITPEFIKLCSMLRSFGFGVDDGCVNSAAVAYTAIHYGTLLSQVSMDFDTLDYGERQLISGAIFANKSIRAVRIFNCLDDSICNIVSSHVDTVILDCYKGNSELSNDLVYRILHTGVVSFELTMHFTASVVWMIANELVCVRSLKNVRFETLSTITTEGLIKLITNLCKVVHRLHLVEFPVTGLVSSFAASKTLTHLDIAGTTKYTSRIYNHNSNLNVLRDNYSIISSDWLSNADPEFAAIVHRNKCINGEYMSMMLIEYMIAFVPIISSYAIDAYIFMWIFDAMLPEIWPHSMQRKIAIIENILFKYRLIRCLN